MKNLSLTLGGRVNGKRLSGSVTVHRRLSGYVVTIKCNDRTATREVSDKQYSVLRIIDVVGWLDPITN
jgi:hypothetical protein